MKKKQSLFAGTVLAGLAVVTGAFGAHALEDMVSPDRLTTWETAVQYQMYHALALILLGILQTRLLSFKLLDKAAIFFLVGVIIFSGSLYGLVLLDISWLGAITPIGGISFILGWMMFALSIYKYKPELD